MRGKHQANISSGRALAEKIAQKLQAGELLVDLLVINSLAYLLNHYLCFLTH